ncbi:phospholipase D TDEL_0D01270 [Torulaspora delbrueckii]|uniref:Phospholipase n=1 Tax=Torulaspora delbrueckii TaxID=4950 RepID=G8ZSW7_TORDE|nr:hypothetical protein TDEL_0D01270 [Torulaspora delbrueckii]CCE91711.1 hypothetical protein TDEL_0D01270 [Torulaspora delbrueckii]
MGGVQGDSAVVPGIYEARELGGDIEEESQSDNGGDEDREAAYKNLTFHGVPNSAVQDGPDEGEEDVERCRSPSGKRKSFIQDQQFDIWRKEFKQAFRKVAVLSKLKAARNVKQQHRESLALQHAPIDEKDRYTQKLASDLLDSLAAGCPAALFASTHFLRDEHGQRRAPLLLAMLGVRVEPLAPGYMSREEDEGNRNEVPKTEDNNANDDDDSSSIFEGVFKKGEDGPKGLYKLHLEYGIGENRLKWCVIKSYKDLSNLHSRLKLVSFQENTMNKLYIDHNRYHRFYLPHFPRIDDHETSMFVKQPTTRLDVAISSSSSSHSSTSSLNFSMDRIKVKHLQDLIDEPEDLTQPMYLRIERYLRLLNIALCLRPQANRLFQFYELSPIGNLLSYEEHHQSKQGYLIIRSTAKSQGWRVSHFKFNDFKEMIERHTTKWFLVRHSYILYVSDLYSTTPLDVFIMDSKFKIKFSGSRDGDENLTELDWNAKNSKIGTKLLITLQNGERKLQVICKSESSLKQWVSSISHAAHNTVWTKRHRFDSFAPIRRNAFCKFLVDGRDYFWALSEALRMAEDVIYIHDWWLSPELYMRRPVNGNQEFRIDRILKERAEKGVKIFIVVYRNVANTVGTDSLWTKHSMLSLHPNIHLIRSPNQWLQNTYFWAHHEKMTVIDNTIAFMGGIDLCYGRYDTPEHVLKDDHDLLKDQIFPGKDYSNARVCDFYDLDKPFESMYDRRKVPRMPWHDVHMMTVGEAARDMARHFVQRWNYLLRQKRPSRPTPLLTPPSDFYRGAAENFTFLPDAETESTCEVQVIRSAGAWSLGLKETEKSIQNAYLKLIEASEHFIYIENQFFISTSHWDGVVIENNIGDAIVDRIIRANSEGKTWKAFILIPLMPGFDSPIDQPEASSVRVIMQCQYQSISRGETSIFSRLKKLNIDPLQYIQFFSLRKWAAIGPQDKLVTEQLYVHAKVLIADDRSCIIGSANINERSQLGNRDSEVAMIIRDTDLVKSKMEDKDYYAGRFAFELRKRLMREHLGCNVDLVEIVERKFGHLEELAKMNYKTLNTLSGPSKKSDMMNSAMVEVAYREVFDVEYSDSWKAKFSGNSDIKQHGILSFTTDDSGKQDDKPADGPLDSMDPNSYQKTKLPDRKASIEKEIPSRSIKNYHSFNYRAGEENVGIRDNKPVSSDPRLTNNEKHKEDVEGLGLDGWKKVTKKFKETVTEQLREWAFTALGSDLTIRKREQRRSFLPDKNDIEEYLCDESTSYGQRWDMLKRISYLQHLSFKNKSANKQNSNSKTDREPRFGNESKSDHEAHVEILEDQELDDDCIDDLLVQMAPNFEAREDASQKLFNLRFIDPYSFDDPICPSFYEDLWFSIALRNTLLFRLVFHCQPDNAVQSWRDYKEYCRMSEEFSDNQDALIDLEKRPQNASHRASSTSAVPGKGDLPLNKEAAVTVEKGTKIAEVPQEGLHRGAGKGDSPRPGETQSKRSKATALRMRLSGSLLFGFNQRIFDKYTARRILERVHGHLVVFPTEWLAKETESKNWFYNVDRIPPIDIYD